MQSFKKKINSAKGKAITLIDYGLEPFLEGKRNFENPIDEIENLAKERAEICVSCELFEDEAIEECMVTDSRIPELSNKMCGDCFCIEAYKLRQSIKKCNKWLR